MRPAVVTAVLLLAAIINTVTAGSVPPWETCTKLADAACALHGWTRFDGSRCMKYITVKKTFTQAQKHCRCMKSELLSIHNEDENNRAMCLSYYSLSPTKPVSFWIGAQRTKGVFNYLDGSEFKFTKWAPLEPYNYLGKEDCLEINYKDWGLWNDSKCSLKNHFVCVKKA